MLFKKEHIQPILDGRKTETRRLSLRVGVGVGRTTVATTNYTKAGQFARIRIVDSFVQRIGDMTEAQCRAELCESVDEYLALLNRVNPKAPKADRDTEVRAYVFEVVRA